MVENQINKKVSLTLTERLRELFRQPLERMGSYLHAKGIRANQLTITGILGTLVGSVFVSQGKLVVGGIFILGMGVLDAFDGAVARASKAPKKFGAFLDSVSDRYIELFIYGALSWYFLRSGNQLGVIFSYIAAGGSVLVSYARARAQSIGLETKVGALTRVERLVVIGPAIIFNFPLIGVFIVGILANFTAIQRIYDVWRQTKSFE